MAATRFFLALISVFAGLTAAHAESWPIKKGEIFYKARPALLREGWKPVMVFTKSEMDLPENAIGEGRKFYRHGFKEVEECSLGKGYCAFHYRMGDRCLMLTTEGEYIPPKSPTVDNWWTYPVPVRNPKSRTLSMCSYDAAMKAGFNTSTREH